MSRRRACARLLFCCVLVLGAAGRSAFAQGYQGLTGTWVLNKNQSEFPREVGFGMDLLPAGAGEPGDADLGGRGGGTPVFAPSRETEISSRNTRQLVAEVRSPASWLNIVHGDGGVTVTDASGQTRSFRATGKDDSVRLGAGPVTVLTRWESGRLVVRYKVSQARELRYTYSVRPETGQLLVEIRFVERNGRDALTRVYDPLPPGSPLPPPDPPQSDTTTKAASGAGVPPGADPRGVPADPRGVPADPRGVPAGGGEPDEPISNKADAELAGISRLGVVIEELTAQASACGLDKAAIEAAVTKNLTDAGFKVARNSDEDTYLYVDVITVSVSNGLCVSRYDASLFTHATARLSYQSGAALVRVLLLHDGGIAGGGPKEHTERLMTNLLQHVTKFGDRVRAAGK